MNGYIYEVENEWIIERYSMYGKDRPIVNMWSFNQLKKDNDSVSKMDRESFVRTKRWLDCHPELII
jgi:hypothetical protein